MPQAPPMIACRGNFPTNCTYISLRGVIVGDIFSFPFSNEIGFCIHFTTGILFVTCIESLNCNIATIGRYRDYKTFIKWKPLNTVSLVLQAYSSTSFYLQTRIGIVGNIFITKFLSRKDNGFFRHKNPVMKVIHKNPI